MYIYIYIANKDGFTLGLTHEKAIFYPVVQISIIDASKQTYKAGLTYTYVYMHIYMYVYIYIHIGVNPIYVYIPC